MVATLEPKIIDLEQHVRKTLGDLMPKLEELEKLTGVSTMLNLGRFAGEVTQQKKGKSSDPRFNAALKRGGEVREKLKIAEGGSFSAGEAARELGMTKMAILNRFRAGKLVGWQEERQRAYRFPRWQFANGKVLPGMESVLAQLKESANLDDFGRLLFFLAQCKFLNGKSPLELLRNGELHKVLQAAAGYGQ